jgi:uncharacterized protein (TIGR02099 family)
MKSLFKRLLKIAGYAGAALVITLAIMLGLFRLFLPRLPEYQDEIKAWTSRAIGMQVEFAGMDARWGLLGPELTFYDAQLKSPATGHRVVAAGEVGIGVSLAELVSNRALVVDTVRVRDSAIEIRELEDGTWLVQGSRLEDLVPRNRTALLESVEVVGQDIELQVSRADDNVPTVFRVPGFNVERDRLRTAIDATLRLPEDMGRTLEIGATLVENGPDIADHSWNITLDAAGVDFSGLARLYRDEGHRVTAGVGDVDLSFTFAAGAIGSASALVALDGLRLNDGPEFDIAGRLAYTASARGWLAAADELLLATANGKWPLSGIRVETAAAGDGATDMVDLQASHIELADWIIAANWLDREQRDWLEARDPGGAVTNVLATVSGLGEDSPVYAVSARLEDVALTGTGKWPGINGVTATVRVDQDGGLLEFDTDDASIDMQQWVPEPLDVERIGGTVTWRRSGSRTTILSHNLVFRNAIVDSENSIEIILADGRSPAVDLTSTFAVNDVAAAKRYIPARIMSPRLHAWFQDALEAGRITDGRARLSGSLAEFPFDEGGGSLRIDGRAEDLALRYLPTFPPVDASVVDIVLENTHLYTVSNRSVTAGNTTVDAELHIRDLRRDPVLTLDARSRGTLETLRQFAQDSPIAKVFGGQLDRVTVDGPATVELDLEVPLRRWREFEFLADVSSDDGSLAVAGLPAPFTELSGTVTIRKDGIASDALTGRFLGERVDVELSNAGPDRPGYGILASATGGATATALVGELGLPLDGRLAGKTDFTAEVAFPRGGGERPAPLRVTVESDLDGLAVDLPAPFQKSAGESRKLDGELVIDPLNDQILSNGRIAGEAAWGLRFENSEGAWDFDRGVLFLGDAGTFEPDVRGLHVRGATPFLDVAEWLSVSRGAGAELGAGDRVRSIEIDVGELRFLGQRLEGQRVRVDRSARDWLVQLDGEFVSGSVFVPYDFGPDATLVLDMQRLVFPGDGDSDEVRHTAPREIDPRTLPAIELTASEFGLGERRFGAVEANFRHDENGLVSDKLSARGDSFSIVGSARWLADPGDPLGSQTYLDIQLESTDVNATMRQLGYQPGILSEEMQIALDMGWSGGPRGGFLESLDGTVQVRLGSGQLDEVEPGAGRVFGLLSIVALPRRLALDFRDVFQKGFGFDQIDGTFRLENGVAMTCNLSLQAPAADIGIVGRADLLAGNYSQTAVISANVGNTLPVVGAIAAGPQVAAAMFLFSQIFKKPLKDLGQIYYRIEGPWDSPVVESADASDFAESGALAGCLEEEIE